MLESFHLFPDLPPEIRERIWAEALPTLRPSLYFDHRGCWRCVDPPVDLDGAEVCLKHDSELVRPTWVEVPHLEVNQEARHAALSWAEKRGLDLAFLPNQQRLALLCPFYYAYDGLYVPRKDWDDFFNEQFRILGDDADGKRVMVDSHVENLILTENCLEEVTSDLKRICSRHPNLTTLYILTDVPSEFDSTQALVWPTQSWQIVPTAGKFYQWSPEDGMFHIYGRPGVGDTEVDASIKRVCVALSKDGGFGYDKFRIAPITVFPLSE